MNKDYGKKVWIFPDGELPPAGNFPCKGHESIMILNTHDEVAKVKLTIYYSDSEPTRDIDIVVNAERVRCIRLDHPADIGGVEIERGVQYAMVFESSVPVIIQYGRLDTRDQPMHFYINTGYYE